MYQGQSRERSSVPLHLGVVAIEKGAFWLPSTAATNFTLLIIGRYHWYKKEQWRERERERERKRERERERVSEKCLVRFLPYARVADLALRFSITLVMTFTTCSDIKYFETSYYWSLRGLVVCLFVVSRPWQHYFTCVARQMTALAGIETWLILSQSNILPLTYRTSLRKGRDF